MKHFYPSLTVCSILFSLLIFCRNALQAQSADSLKSDSSKNVSFPIISGNSAWTSRRIIQNDQKLVAGTPEQLMAGQMAGVRVIETNGAPGGVFSVQVRGAAALASSNEPLYIVDGIPQDVFNTDYGLAELGENYPSGAPNVLSIINPSDIESIEIVKNGSAIAMYGSRAGNGAVLIRTKRGRTNGLHVDFESTASIQRKKHAPEILSTEDFKAYQKRLESLYPKQAQLTQYIEDPSFSYESINWIDEATQTGTAFRQQLGISGGLDFLKFSVQGNLSDQKGVVKNSGYDRKGVRVNLDFNFFKNRLRFGTSTYYAKARMDVRDIQPTYDALPFGPPDNADGSRGNIKIGPWTRENPLDGVDRSADRTDVRRLFTAQYLEVGIVKGLTLKAQYGISGSQQDRINPRINNPYGTYAFVDHDERTLDATLNYRYAWKNNVWTISGGYAQQKFDKTAGEAHGKDQDLVSRWLEEARDHNIIPGSGPTIPFSYSYFRRRADSKSFFAQTSFATGGWDFYVNARKDDWVKSFGSIGGSVGWLVPDKGGRLAKIGINSLRLVVDYGHIEPISSVWVNSISGSAKLTRNMMSIGSELGLLSGKLHVELDIFNQVTNNQAYSDQIRLPGGGGEFGYAGVKGLYSRGIELSATGEVLRRNDLSWKISGNLTAMANRIRKPLDFFGFLTDEDKTNQPVGSWFSPRLDGVWNTPQEILDAGYGENRVPELLGGSREAADAEWSKQIGSAFPNVFWGLSSMLEWRRFDVTMLIRGEHGQKIYNGADQVLHTGFVSNTTYYAAENAWAPDRPDNNFPRQWTLYGAQNRFWYLQKGSFVRLQNLAIGYTFPILKEKSARVFLSGQNLILLTKYKGWDPEVSHYGQSIQQRGYDYGAYPRAMTLSLGVQLHL
ncbi:TonB-dependent outer membrane receptor, SusC/RagA subfamily, signature region [Dyadobacter sp. SG02]|uniref:TonB-dependent receptor plug domain-containing protein n=1 Tax=Dyadobacter sp. SG02 TaxID=1855291 RepID=UPI0008BDEB49|nr:TonB-dependent receptor plug domain-containing protein [Dyadobacter sp. SG02]SEJ43482.1 TonB-dependent outer membrane receptor, SusC/RagA subfamily, signature region [Dyadobacter sp. SG02]